MVRLRSSELIRKQVQCVTQCYKPPQIIIIIIIGVLFRQVRKLVVGKISLVGKFSGYVTTDLDIEVQPERSLELCERTTTEYLNWKRIPLK